MDIRVAGALKHSSVNGPGVRYVLFFQGCFHACPGCQNPETHSRDGGVRRDTRDVIAEILSTKYLDGVTLSGGDPFVQPEALGEIVRACRRAGLNVWVYTGFTYEQIIQGAAGDGATDILEDIDVLIDGRFVEALRDGKCRCRGSSNQRLIDVQASLREGRAVIMDEK